MSAKKGGLNKGRGLEALIGGGTRKKDKKTEAEPINDNNSVTSSDAEEITEKKKAAEKAKSKPKTKSNVKSGSKSRKEDIKSSKKETAVKTKKAKAAEPANSTESVIIEEETPAVSPAKAEEKKEKKKVSSSDTDVTSEKEVNISLIIPNSEQPRREFDEAALEELAESIKIHGVLQPLLVQKKGKYYEIIAGERRWRAAKMVGLKKVPVIVRDYTPRQTLEISLIENIQRQDLNPIDEAFAYKRLLEEFSLKQAEVAKRVSKSRATITNALRLLKLDERVQRLLVDNVISTGHARALLSIEDGELQFEVANRIATEGLNVRDTEKLINNLKKKPIQRTRTDNVQINSVYAPIEEQLKQVLGTKVTLHPKRSGRGSIEIEYYSGEDLERILDLLSRSGEEPV